MLDKKLMNVANQMESDMLVELLKNNGIPSLTKTSGSGGYMQITMGMNMFGVDIYVNEEDFEKAKEIADEFFGKDGTDSAKAGDEGNTREIKTELLTGNRVIAGFLFAIIVIVLIWSLL